MKTLLLQTAREIKAFAKLSQIEQETFLETHQMELDFEAIYKIIKDVKYALLSAANTWKRKRSLKEFEKCEQYIAMDDLTATVESWEPIKEL